MHETVSIIPFFFAVTVGTAAVVFFIVLLVIIHNQRQNRMHAEKETLVFDHHNKLLTARVEEQERTMDQISKEIHDHIGQLLSFAKMNMFVVSKYAENPLQVETIENVKTLLDQLIKDVQTVSHSLNSEFIKKRGLAFLLKEELKYINFGDKKKCELIVEGDQVTLRPEKELLIYRVAQEAIHNSTKHSKATQHIITLAYNADEFTMTVADNGVGFDTQKVYELKGIGFLNMLQRAKLLNGTLDIQSKPNHGCKIILHVPSIADLMEQNAQPVLGNGAIVTENAGA